MVHSYVPQDEIGEIASRERGEDWVDFERRFEREAVRPVTEWFKNRFFIDPTVVVITKRSNWSPSEQKNYVKVMCQFDSKRAHLHARAMLKLAGLIRRPR